MAKQVKLSEQIIPKYHKTFNDTKYTHKIFTSRKSRYEVIKTVE